MNYCLTGAIIGSIAGSRLSYYNRKEPDPEFMHLVSNDCTCTDAVVLNLATKFSLDSKGAVDFAGAYKFLTRLYPDIDYGFLFFNWVMTNSDTPNKSWGAGASMRIAYLGDYAASLGEAQRLAAKSAICTHDTSEAILAANVFASCVWMLRHDYDKADVLRYARKMYNMSKDFSDFYKTDTTAFDCKTTLMQALNCFAKGTNYITCIRNMYRMCCDHSTVGAMTGALAGAYYQQFPPYALKRLPEILPDYLLNIWDKHAEETIEREIKKYG